jgi:hypothetical protein
MVFLGDMLVVKCRADGSALDTRMDDNEEIVRLVLEALPVLGTVVP